MKKKELVNRLLSIDKQISTRSWITAGGDLGELIDELREEINRETFLPSNLDEAAAKWVTERENLIRKKYYPFVFDAEDIFDAFKAGAEWQKEQKMED